MVYSESDAIYELHQIVMKKYSNTDIRQIHRIIHDLMSRLTGNGEYAYHYNKYTIIMSCLQLLYKDYPHGKEIVLSYSTYISEQLQHLRLEEYQKKQETNRSSFGRYCVLL